MQTKNVILSLIVAIGLGILWTGNASATTWYVRDGGGPYGNTTSSCNGLFNNVFNGNNGPDCAVKNPDYILGLGCDNFGLKCTYGPKISSGDTVYINGDSDLSIGQQARYPIGWDPNSTDYFNKNYGNCKSTWAYACTMANLPAGLSASQPTSIIGVGSHKPQLYGINFPYEVLEADNNYITLQNLEITDHVACAYNNPAVGCRYEDGIWLGGTGLVLTDVYVHGLSRLGINTDNLGNAKFTRLWIIGNGLGGFTTGTSAIISGTLTFNQPIVEWNGCVEAYPINGAIDNPSNYTNCFGQASGGYGDGVAFGNTGRANSGNWTILGPGSISFNTQDGLDTLHGIGNGTIQIDKMRFEGNAGQQVKANALNFSLTNSVVVADCGWWDQASQSLSGGMGPGDSCRALGDAILFNVTNGSTANLFNNSILSNGNVTLESIDFNNTGCNAGTSINVYNNIVYGGPAWIRDRAIISTGDNGWTTYIYNSGNNGDGSGTCGALRWNENYNTVFGTKNNNQGCAGANDKCGVSPAFANLIPMGTSGGAANTYYQGQAAETLVSLSPASPAIGAGDPGLSFWNNSNDYHNVTRVNPPTIGALEQNSCAAVGFGCFFNSDCCSNICSSSVCGTAPTVSITSSTNSSNVTAGSNVTVTAKASEDGGQITNLSLLNGNTVVSSSNSSTLSHTFNNIAVGTYALTAKATDASGVSSVSSAVTFTVTDPILPSLPMVSITAPVTGSSFTAGSNITFTANASETNGKIAKVSYYSNNSTLLGSSTVSPYSVTVNNLLVGAYSITAVATDAFGVTATSKPVSLAITTPPLLASLPVPVVSIINPVNGASFTAGTTVSVKVTASETNGTIAKISLYSGSGALLGTASGSAYVYFFTNSVPGAYSFHAVATDVKGKSTTSSTVTITLTKPATTQNTTQSSSWGTVVTSAPAIDWSQYMSFIR